tara:strand:- start:4569 stop:7529 length:2961 start_codon:yes stop_codon:yes gene_type:complete
MGKRYAMRTMTGSDVLRNMPVSRQLSLHSALESAGKGMGVSDYAKIMDQPLAGRMNYLGRTFGAGAPTRSLGTQTLMDAAMKGIGDTGVARAAKASLGYPFMGRLTKEVQAHMPGLFQKTERAKKQAFGEATNLARQLDLAGMTEDQFSDAIYQYVELGALPTSRTPAQVVEKVGNQIKRLQEESNVLLNSKGVKTNELLDIVYGTVDDFKNDPDSVFKIGYAARFADDVLAQAMGKKIGGLEVRGSSPLSAIDATANARENFLKGFDRGTVGVNELLMDKDIHKVIDKATMRGAGGDVVNRQQLVNQVANEIQKKYGNVIREAFEVQGKVHSRYSALADFMMMHPETRTKGLFTDHIVRSVGKRLQSNAVRAEIAESLTDLAAEQSTSFMPAGGKSLRDVFDESQFDPDAIAGILRQKNQDALGNLTDKQIMDRMVPTEVFDDLKAMWDRSTLNDRGGNKMLELYDSMTNLFKVGVLTWPARYFRDLVSGQVRNAEMGLFSFGGVSDATSLMMGKTVKGAKEIPAVQQYLGKPGKPNLNITDEQATEALRRMYAEQGPTFIERTDIAGTDVPAQQGLEALLTRMPGRSSDSLGSRISDLASTFAGRKEGTTRNPFDIRGVMDFKTGSLRNETKFGPAAAGDILGEVTDTANRLVGFMTQIRKGVSADDAMRNVNSAQINYNPSNYTPAERHLKRIFPFYSFARGNFMHMANELMQRPGGRTAQVIRAMNRAHSPDEATPDYVAGTASIPLGQKPDGSRSYITGLGLMNEPFLQNFGGGARGMMLNQISAMNPLIKAPLEEAFGKSAFQDRNIRDLDPVIGRTLSNILQLSQNPSAAFTGGETESVRPVRIPGAALLEPMIANSPLARAATTVRQLTDPRKSAGNKALNLLTGARMTDISPAAQEAIMRERLSQLMRSEGAKEFVRTYFQQDSPEFGNLPINEQQQLMAMQAYMNYLAQLSKDRAEARKQSGRSPKSRSLLRQLGL